MRTERVSGKLNNAGFSLVEMVVVVLLSAVVALMVAGFMEASRTTYQKVDEDAELQTESQAATSFLREIAGCAKDAGWTKNFDGSSPAADVYGNEGINFATAGVTLNSNKGIAWFEGFDYENASSNETIVYVFVLDNNKMLRYASYTRSSLVEGGSFSTAKLVANINRDLLDDGTNSKYALLAEHVDSIKMSSSSGAQGTLFSMELGLSYREHNYSSTIKVLARNMK